MGYIVPPARDYRKNVGFAAQYFVAARSHTNGMLPCCSLSCLQLQRFTNNESAAQYCGELAFSLARLRFVNSRRESRVLLVLLASYIVFARSFGAC